MNYLVVYAALLALVLVLYVRRQRRRVHQHQAELQASVAGGLAEPPSLHPVANPLICMGSGSCAQACPEQALGIVGGKAVLVNAAACIGHGACMLACPVEAIKLVFGTERRGIDIPNISPEFETNVPGIYIAGELGGMGLIRKAAEQGRQAIDAIRRRTVTEGNDYDVLIVGCGPAGLSAGLAAIHHGLRYKLIEQEDSLGGAVYHYPRNKITMTAPVELALVGKVRFGEVQKEKLLEFWNGVVAKTGLAITFRERMQGIQRQGGGFVVQTDRAAYRAGSVLLAMGRRGTPRKLDVPGEECSKVVYRLVDAAQYAGQKVLVVGGGDSALEAAITIAEQPGSEVVLSYRGESFSRVKQKNRERVDAAVQAGRLSLLLGSTVQSIEPRTVHIEHGGRVHSRANDAVIVCAGGLLPTPLLQSIGIQFDTKYGHA